MRGLIFELMAAQWRRRPIGIARGAGCILVLTACVAGCSSSESVRPRDPYALDLPGPAIATMADGGYQLANRHLRLVIDPNNGDVIWFGPSGDGAPNFAPARLCVRALGALDVVPAGHVEKRDDETWMYVGEDARQLRWRKIYCLHNDSLFASTIVENMSEAPMDSQVVWVGQPNGAAAPHLTTHAEARAGGFVLEMQAFTLTPPQSQIDDKLLMVGDPRRLIPGERISFTTEWRCRPVAGTTRP